VNFNNYHITHDLHHLPVAYLLTVPVASVCKGSRTFRVGVDVYWSSGNPVKIDGGKVNVINYTRSTTATVPNVLEYWNNEATRLPARLLGARASRR